MNKSLLLKMDNGLKRRGYEVLQRFNEHLFLVSRNGRQGVFSTKARRMLIPAKYDMIVYCSGEVDTDPMRDGGADTAPKAHLELTMYKKV